MTSDKQQLIDTILSHNHSYAKGLPVITDTEYDILWKKLHDIDPECPVLYHTGENSQLPFDQRAHRHQIYGTNKAFSMTDLKPFLTRFGSQELILEPKYDGCAGIFYKGLENDKLILEGNGLTGRDITHHLPCINPLRNPQSMESVEILIPNENWAASFGANPRNVVAGWINSKTFPIMEMASMVSHNNGSLFHYYTYDGNLDTFYTQLLTLYSKWSLLYPLDGIMIKVANEKQRIITGNNGTSYNWSIAWKPPIQTAETIVTAIEWNVSRSGRVIPTVIYEPIELCGTTNKRVTGNNATWILEHGITVGCKIEVGKAGEIIPKIIRVVERAKTPQDGQKVPFNGGSPASGTVIATTHKPSLNTVLTHCPICNTSLEWKALDLICPGISCIAQLTKSIAYFYSDKGMDIDGIGETRVYELLQNDTIRQVLSKKPWALLDPVNQHLWDLIKLIWGDKRSHNYLNALTKRQNQKNAINFIAALGLPKLAYKTAMKLFYYVTEGKKYPGIAQISMASFSEAYVTYHKAKNDLPRFKFSPVPPLPDTMYCITGTLSLSRNGMITYLEKYGWQFSNAVSKQVKYLIVGDNPGKTKMQAASEKTPPTTTITEHELTTILKGTKK